MYTAQGKLKSAAGTHEVMPHMPLIRRIAHHLAGRLPPSVDVDDLIQIGVLGLMDAIDHYTVQEGATFETYAGQRIRGAMIDHLRSMDIAPRSARKALRDLETAIGRLEQRFCRPPSEPEIAGELGVEISEYHVMLGDAHGYHLFFLGEWETDEDGNDPLERHFPASDAWNPAHQVEDQDMRRNLIAAIEALPERERLVMALYYDEELNLKEIGAVLGVGEARVCQIHKQAIARIRAKMG